MNPSIRRLLPLLVLVALACAFSFSGGNVASCEGGCFGDACATAAGR